MERRRFASATNLCQLLGLGFHVISLVQEMQLNPEQGDIKRDLFPDTFLYWHRILTIQILRNGLLLREEAT